MKQKVLLALNYRKFEEALEMKMKDKFDFVGTATYREVIVDKVRQTNPDILIIREAIPGTKSIIDIIYTIRNNHKNVRIIFMTGRREPGDLLLADLVSYGVYDIITSESILMKEVVSLIQKPQSFDDVSYLLPKPSGSEPKPEKSFEPDAAPTKAPEPTPVVPDPSPTIKVEPDIPTSPVTPISAPPKVEEKPVVIPDPEPKPEPPKEVITTPPPARPPLDEPTPSKKKFGGGFKKFRQKSAPAEPNPNMLALPPAPTTPPVMEMPALPFGMTQGKRTVVQSKQIVSFIGAVNGVGNTQMALNTAVKLAQDGHSVLFIELNPNFSTVDTSFQLGSYQHGLEKALDALAKQNQRDVSKHIIRMEDIQKNTKNTNPMSKNYKRIPATLDFLFFSQDYQTLVFKPKVAYSQLKDLAMLLLLQGNYDFVVIDSEPFGKNPEVIQDLASISSKIVVTLNQETSQIGHVSRNIIELNKRINVEEKLYYILNKEVPSECDRAMVEDWLEVQMSITVPDNKQHFMNASFLGIPYVVHSKDQTTQQAFETLKQIIQQN